MKFVMTNGELVQKFEDVKAEVGIRPIDDHVSEVLDKKGKIHLIDLRDLRESWNYLKIQWFGRKGAVAYELATAGIFWGAFMTHIFPIMLEIAKVYCAIMIAKGFFDEHRGGGRAGGASSGFEGIIRYGKWYLFFALMPWAVELIGGLGDQMYNDLMEKRGGA